MNSPQKILAIFEREIELFTLLLQKFQAEKEILKKRDTDALNLLQAEKAPIVEELENLQKECIGIMAESGFKDSLKDIENYFLQQPASIQKALRDTWQQLVTLGEKCRMENLTIGGIVELNRLQIETALGILRGSKGITTGYNTKGRLNKDCISQTLAKA